mmetsp:Transcript_50921/g.80784  ORF Transcript_50921/g.80784 Transcript_50921/m.80784 type:complete len:179 (-) Transcript_50921:174-710(-)|eukprot:CAMPEP_0169108898 /NCGR_PEP_ID=MMETSP1015-20121227/25676_1 /TAXON_ID=342587 /ORGANISM="Karlodinium micrum, Strain CCMP2283" /LENGTH=178 /DNA_ID=CAMNT_0009170557 /DNA_START=152 /DNA_END=688 /DNA_ORIENTATION=-
MAHFGDCGVHCANPYCRQKDFLPTACDACGEVFCSEHFKYDAHDCPKGRADKDKRVIVCPICTKGVSLPPGEDPNRVWETHAASGDCHPPPPPKPKCPVSGCKEKLTSISSITCGTCGQKVCMKHRFEDSHDCRPQRSKAALKSAGGQAGTGNPFSLIGFGRRDEMNGTKQQRPQYVK